MDSTEHVGCSIFSICGSVRNRPDRPFRIAAFRSAQKKHFNYPCIRLHSLAYPCIPLRGSPVALHNLPFFSFAFFARHPAPPQKKANESERRRTEASTLPPFRNPHSPFKRISTDPVEIPPPARKLFSRGEQFRAIPSKGEQTVRFGASDLRILWPRTLSGLVFGRLEFGALSTPPFSKMRLYAPLSAVIRRYAPAPTFKTPRHRSSSTRRAIRTTQYATCSICQRTSPTQTSPDGVMPTSLYHSFACVRQVIITQYVEKHASSPGPNLARSATLTTPTELNNTAWGWPVPGPTLGKTSKLLLTFARSAASQTRASLQTFALASIPKTND
jgi:hypothetical protein